MDSKPSEIMTIEELASYLRIPLSSAYKLAQEGKIPGLKVGRHWRFHRVLIERWMKKKSQNQSPEQDKRT